MARLAAQQLLGRRVKLLRDITVMVGTTYPAGSLFSVVAHQRGRFHIRQDHLAGIQWVSRKDFELLEVERGVDVRER
jgi:hypothetical protein